MSPKSRAGHPDGLEVASVLLIEHTGRGGVADYTARLAEALADRGIHVRVATATDHVYSLTPRVDMSRVFTFVRPTSGVRWLLRRIGLSPVANAVLYAASIPRVVRLGRGVDLVHLQHGNYRPLDALMVAALRCVGVPVVWTPHNVFERYGSYQRARKIIVHMVTCIIVHAEADLHHLSQPVRAKTVVLPHGEYGGLARTVGAVNADVARKEFGFSTEGIVALAYGQLRPDKGLGDLLAAATSVPELHLLVAGEDLGSLVEQRSRLRSSGLDGRVVVREGFQSMDETARLFAAADVVVLPYKRASQSGVLLLAYGFARPVVVYPVGGLPEAVRENTGWVCAAANAEALASTLRHVVAAGRTECLRRGRAGQVFAQSEFSWSAVAERTAQIYGSACVRGL